MFFPKRDWKELGIPKELQFLFAIELLILDVR